jgi:metal-responsive CopG/Arc/MetJ family transcriptional regulator
MKIAISVPDPVFEAAEALARELKVSRSQLYSRALAAYLDTRGAAAVSEKLNAVYAADPQRIDRALARAQSATLDDETW